MISLDQLNALVGLAGQEAFDAMIENKVD
jgi:hypothetical protein